MSDVNPNLSAQAEFEIQQKFTSAVQLELGVLKSTVLMMEQRVQAHLLQRVTDLQLIEGLKARAFAAEDKMRELYEENVKLKTEPVKTVAKRRRNP